MKLTRSSPSSSSSRVAVRSTRWRTAVGCKVRPRGKASLSSAAAAP
jgi:hypothetical protein